MRIVLVETRRNGHHLDWLCNIRDVLVAAGHKVTVVYPDAERIPYVSGSTVLKGPDSYRDEARLRLFPTYSFRRWVTLRSLVGLIRNSVPDADLILFCYIDALMMEIPCISKLTWATMPCPWVALWFHPPRHIAEKLPRNASIFKSDTCKSIGLLCEDRIGKIANTLDIPVIQIPDPNFTSDAVPNYRLSSRLRSLAAGRPVVGLIGTLNRRKGLLELSRITKRKNAGQMFFVIAGELLDTESYSKETLNELDNFLGNPPENVAVINRHLESDCFETLVDFCDLIWVVYRDFSGSSNMLAKAAKYQKPVLGSNGGLIAKRVEKYSLGIVVDLDDWKDPISDMLDLIKMDETSKRQQKLGQSNYLTDHSPSTFGHAIRRLILST